MNSLMRYALFTCSVVLFGSCGNLKPCNEKYTKFERSFQSKRLKQSINERDSLCNLAAKNEKQLLDYQNELDALRKNLHLFEDSLINGQAVIREQERLIQELDERYETLLKVTEKSLVQASANIENKEYELEEREIELSEFKELVEYQKQKLDDVKAKLEKDLVYTGDDLKIEQLDNGKIRLVMDEKLLFKSGSADIGNEGKQILKDVANTVKKLSNIGLTVEGHTDDRLINADNPKFNDNWDLSAARANAVAKEMVGSGLNSGSIKSSARGDEVPIADNSTSVGRSENRRVEVYLYNEINNNGFEKSELVTGLKIVAEPRDAHRYMMLIDKWNDIKKKSKNTIINYVESNQCDCIIYLGKDDKEFDINEDVYRAIIIKNGEINSGQFIAAAKASKTKHLRIK